MQTKLIFLLLFALSFSTLFSQDINVKTLDDIYEKGKSFTLPIKNGKIESLKNANPPKDTWLFSKLEIYKQNLGLSNITYGSTIMPSYLANSNLYSFNLFAYDMKKEFYYFVIVVSYEVLNDKIQFKNSFLFTENESLQGWWMNIFSFYESKEFYLIPEQYKFKTCPPPPSRD